MSVCAPELGTHHFRRLWSREFSWVHVFCRASHNLLVLVDRLLLARHEGRLSLLLLLLLLLLERGLWLLLRRRLLLELRHRLMRLRV